MHGRLRKRKKKRDAVEAQRTENAKKKHAADVLARKDAMALYERTREAAIDKMQMAVLRAHLLGRFAVWKPKNGGKQIVAKGAIKDLLVLKISEEQQVPCPAPPKLRPWH